MQHNNENGKYVYYDSSNVKHEIEIVDGDFDLASVDKKIHDVKFKTKPTTFAKDAFKRFCKNKSSVVGAVIVGLLLLCAVFIPIIDTYDVDSNHPQERLLEPKLFNAGAGFWDGTKKVTNVVCDQSNVAYTLDGVTYYYPFEDSYSSSAILDGSLTAPVQSTVNTASSGVTGGYVRITNSNQLAIDDADLYEDNKITYSSYSYAFDKNETYGLDIVFFDEEIEDLELGTYRVYLSYSIATNGVSGNTVTGTFTDFEAAEDEDIEEEDAEDFPFAGTWTGELSDGLECEIVLENDYTGTFNGSEIEYAVDTETVGYDSESEESLYLYTITGEGTTTNSDGDDIGFDFELTYDETSDTPTLEVSYTTSEVYEAVLTDGYISTYEELDNDDILSAIRLEDNQEIESLQICIDLLPGVNINTYILIESIEVTTTSESNSEKTIINNMGYGYDGATVEDANASLLLSTSSYGYWKCDGSKNLYKGIAYTCSFTYDTYEAAYGNTRQVVPVTTIKQYAENGWLSEEILDDDYDFYSWYTAYRLYAIGADKDALTSLFEGLKTDLTDAYCPITSIVSVSSGTASGVRYYTITCNVAKYKYLGYTSMPRFLLGTDSYGRDMLKVTFVGLRNSILIAIGIAAICFIFGLIWGSVSGYYGGNTDLVMERITDFLSGIPWIVIVTLCVLNLGNGFGVFLLAMCMTGWIGTASTTRTQFYRFRDREYTLASRTLGARNTRLIFKHILPNAMGTIITSCVLMIPSVIFSEATVSYLGLGFTDIISLGVTLSDNQTYLSTYPYLIIFPSAIMALIMISFNLLGNGLRDALNPSLKGSE